MLGPVCSDATFERVIEQFSARWRAGEKPKAEEYQAGLDSTRFAELAYHEYCLADSSGDAPSPESFYERFPRQRDRLSRLFRLHGALDSHGLRSLTEAEDDLPRVGDEIGPYRLLRELGSGGFARVFLAAQADLADRLVVLKAASRPSPEPRLLAKARHPYIMEILRHGTAEHGALNLICMPFLGGETLSNLLAHARKKGRPRFRSGRRLLALIDEAGAPEYQAAGTPRPTRELIRQSSWIGAWCWIIARLAEALDFAYGRGVTHGDIKPSNVLLAADATPFLFDFNLACDWRDQGDPEASSAAAGGTLAYMSPERLDAVADPGRGGSPRAGERHQADIYALGLVFLEALTGDPPAFPGDRLPPRQMAAALAHARRREPPFRSDAARSLPQPIRSILERALASDPSDRYKRAEHFSADLDRFRTGVSLAYADEPGGISLALRWARRRRWWLAAAGAALLAATTAAAVTRGRADIEERSSALAAVESYWDYAAPDIFWLRPGNLSREELNLGRGEIAHRHLARFDVLGSQDWRQRSDVRALPANEREELEAWLSEQAWRYARDLFIQSDDRDQAERALNCLVHVHQLTPATPLLTLAARISKQLGRDPAALPRRHDAHPPEWIELYLRGVEAEDRSRKEALAWFRKALERNPSSFWANYRAGAACFRLSDSKEAARHLRFCLNRQPKNAALRTQYAGCLYFDGNYSGALEECEVALNQKPDFPEAVRTRAFARKKLGLTTGFEDDLKRYETLTRREGLTKSWRLQFDSSAAELERSPERQIECLSRILLVEPESLLARANLASALLRAGRPKDAIAEIDLVRSQDPSLLYARFGRSMILLKLGRGDEALEEMAGLVADQRFDEAIGLDYQMLMVYPQLINEYLKRGSIDKAVAVGEQGVRQSERLSFYGGQNHYALARAYTVATADHPELCRRAAEELMFAAQESRKYPDDLFPRDTALPAPQREAVLRVLKGAKSPGR